MRALTLFGLFAVTSMVVCYSFESRSPWFVLGFAVSCLLGSSYGFLQGAWPFGLVEMSYRPQEMVDRSIRKTLRGGCCVTQ